jgi:hypothetical protein
MLKTIGLIFALSTSIAYAQDDVWYTVHQAGCVSLSDASKGMPDIQEPWTKPSDLLASAVSHGMTLKAHMESEDNTSVMYVFTGHDDAPLNIVMIKGRELCEKALEAISK